MAKEGKTEIRDGNDEECELGNDEYEEREQRT